MSLPPSPSSSPHTNTRTHARAHRVVQREGIPRARYSSSPCPRNLRLPLLLILRSKNDIHVHGTQTAHFRSARSSFDASLHSCRRTSSLFTTLLLLPGPESGHHVPGFGLAVAIPPSRRARFGLTKLTLARPGIPASPPDRTSFLKEETRIVLRLFRGLLKVRFIFRLVALPN